MKKREDDVKEQTHIESRNRAMIAKQSYCEQQKKEELKMFIEQQKREKADQYMQKLRAKAKQTQAAKEQAIKNEQTEKEIKDMHKVSGGVINLGNDDEGGVNSASIDESESGKQRGEEELRTSDDISLEEVIVIIKRKNHWYF